MRIAWPSALLGINKLSRSNPKILAVKAGKKSGYFCRIVCIDSATLVVSIAKKSCSNLLVSKFIFMEETSGIFLLLLQEKKITAANKEIKIFLIPQIKAKK
jgi:hypothetical protein